MGCPGRNSPVGHANDALSAANRCSEQGWITGEVSDTLEVKKVEKKNWWGGDAVIFEKKKFGVGWERPFFQKEKLVWGGAAIFQKKKF